MEYILDNGELQAVLNSHGAELTSVIHNGNQQLWQNETGVWAGHAPVLFPVCGRCGVVVDGRDYPIDLHGFARKSEFIVKERGQDFICFTLCDSDKTREAFPFAFVLELTYRLKRNAIEIALCVTNPAERTLYFSYGGHESYAVKGDFTLRFPEEENFVTLVHDESGRLTGEKIFLGKGKELSPAAEHFANGNTLIFGGLSSRSVALYQNGVLVATSFFPGMENLLLWRSTGTDMICIEPWYNLPDRAGERKELSEKQTIALKAGQTYSACRTVVYG